MFLLKKVLRNEQGLTLIELLVSTMLIVIISTLAFRVLIQGIETSQTIQQETSLRDEADIIIAKFVKDLYTTKQTNIIIEEFNKNSNGNYLLMISSDPTKCPDIKNITQACINTLTKSGFESKDGVTTLYLKGIKHQIGNPKIAIKNTSLIEKQLSVDSTIYEIALNLQLTYEKRGTKKVKTMTFKNRIQTIK